LLDDQFDHELRRWLSCRAKGSAAVTLQQLESRYGTKSNLWDMVYLVLAAMHNASVESLSFRRQGEDHDGVETAATIITTGIPAAGANGSQDTNGHGLADNITNSIDSSNSINGDTSFFHDEDDRREGMVGVNYPARYRPTFSYSTATIKHLGNAHDALRALLSIQHQSEDFERMFDRSMGEFQQIPDALQQIRDVPQIEDELRRTSILRSKSPDDGDWTTKDVYDEHCSNELLISLGATRNLLCEVGDSANAMIESLRPVLRMGSFDDCSRRERRRMLRLVWNSHIAAQVYMASMLVAHASLRQAMETKDERDLDPRLVLKGVERSRMVVSTIGK